MKKEIIMGFLMGILVLFSGCTDITTGTHKAGTFGNSEKDQENLNKFIEKYGDLSEKGEPSFLEATTSSNIIDYMPIDMKTEFSLTDKYIHFWFLYDNFKDGDELVVEWKYLDTDEVIATLSTSTGEDFGRGTSILESPDEGWPEGNYRVIVESSDYRIEKLVEFSVVGEPEVVEPEIVEPETEELSSISMELDSWIKIMDSQKGENTIDGIKAYGAGHRLGQQGIYSKQIFDFADSETFVVWKPIGPLNKYAAFWVYLFSDYVPETGGHSGAASAGFFTTDHSWENSIVLDHNVRYFTRIKVNADGSYEAVTATGDFDTGGGKVIHTKTGQYENANEGSIVIGFNDNYGGTETYVLVEEVGTTASAVGTTPTVEPTLTTSVCDQNIFKNMGFESGDVSSSSGLVAGEWSAYWHPEITKVTDSYSGSYSIEVRSNKAITSPHNNLDGIKQDFYPPLSEGQYTMSCWLKSASGTLPVVMGMSDGNFGFSASSEEFTITETWKRYEYSDKASPGRTFIRLTGTAGTFYIDGCELCLSSSTPTITTEPLVTPTVEPIEPPVVTEPSTDLAAEKFKVGRDPSALAFDGTHMWVTTTGDSSVYKLSLDGTVVDKFKVGNGPKDVIYDHGSIWVANQWDDTVMKLSLDGTIIGTYPVGDYPSALVSDGTNIWVANNKDGNVVGLGVFDGQKTYTYTPLGDKRYPVDLEFDGINVWVGSHWGQLDVFKAEDTTEVAKFAKLGYMSGLTTDGEHVFHTAWHSGGLPSDVKKYAVSGKIWSVDLDLDEIMVSGILYERGHLWVAASVEDKVYKLRASDGALLNSYEVGDGPVDFAFDGTNVWVALSGESAVLRLVE